MTRSDNQEGGVRSASRRLVSSRMPTFAAGLALFLVLLGVYASVRINAFSAFNLQELATVTATLAILAIGQTLVVLTGGFDFSAVAMLAFLNCLFISLLGTTSGNYVLLALGILAAGTMGGALNGWFVAYLRIQPVIATISMFFVYSGAALALLSRPGGGVPDVFAAVFAAGDWGPIPASAGVIALALVGWLVIRHLRVGTNIFAVGSGSAQAFARGINVRRTIVGAYAFAGAFYGLAALTYSAATASGDPRVSFVLMGQMFAAVIIGGTAFGGGRGGAVGSVLGAFCLTLLDAILFSVGFDSYYTGVVFGLVLLVAVLPSGLRGFALFRRGEDGDVTLASGGSEDA